MKESLPAKDELAAKIEAPKPESQGPDVLPHREVEKVEQQEEEEKVSVRSQPHPKMSGAAGTEKMGDVINT